MHFHTTTGCLACHDTRQLSTPVPNTLIVTEYCQVCGMFGLVGVERGKVCRLCASELNARQMRLIQ